MKVLHIQSERLGEVSEVIRYLQGLENAYNHLFAFDLIVSDARKRYAEDAFSWRSGRSKSRTLRQIRDPRIVVLPEDRLRLHGVSVQSPGFWEFLGALNPLETIRKYLVDRHERRRDREYRNSAEAERLRLENQKLKTEVVRARIDILRDLNIPEDRIAAALNLHVVEPLAQLDDAQDSALIGGAEVIEVKTAGEE